MLEPLDLASLPDFGADVEAIAVCLLFAFRDSSHERAVADELRRRLRRPRRRLARGGARVPRVRTGVDDSRGRVSRAGRLQVSHGARGRALAAGLPAPLVMRSSGGVATIEEAAAHPAWALVSGPAAGVVGAARAAQLAGIENAISLDMGGTSTDVCLIAGGEAARSTERAVAGLPIRLPTIDLHTVGAGGGSIAWVDEGGALRVGPRSAGADPGPACYGRGGTRPTVTDANLLLGRLPDRISGGVELDREAAQRALGDLDPADVVAVVNAEMLRALRVVSVERGTIRGSSRSSRSAGPARCTHASSPTSSASKPSSSRKPPACCPPSGSP